MSVSLKLALKYVIFALIATVVNIFAQEGVNYVYDGRFTLFLAIFLGTVAGLFVKYFLDKHYIFCYKTENIAHNTKTFIVYCLMGGVTTCVFWAFEFLFQEVFGTKGMRYFGAVIGLTIGYVTKYCLDRKYVFRGEG